MWNSKEPRPPSFFFAKQGMECTPVSNNLFPHSSHPYTDANSKHDLISQMTFAATKDLRSYGQRWSISIHTLPVVPNEQLPLR